MVVAVVAIKFGRIGTYSCSQSCHTVLVVQRYCSSAVIMIGALQVVLEGMHRHCYFYLNARSPAPAPSPDTTLDGETFPLSKLACFNKVFGPPLLGICPTAQPVSRMANWAALWGKKWGGGTLTKDPAPELQFWRCG